MHRIASIFAGLSLMFVGTSTAIAATINVPGDQPTIAAAINAAVTGDVINIAAGTYNEYNLNPDGKAITIQGTLNANGSLATTIDAQQGGRVFLFNSSEGSGTQIRELIITGGHTDFFGDVGGGIYCDRSNPTIRDCTISGNTAYGGWGGGIYLDSSNSTISGCTISGNTGGNGGGIYLDSSNATISNCTISGNSAIVAGGGIEVFGNSTPTISGCTISGNTVSNTNQGEGGGINSQENGNPTINGGTVCGNSPKQIDGTYTAGQPEPVIAPTCSPPTGACCLDGTCVTTTPSDCAAAGGTYESDDAACADANCATTTPGDVDGDGDVDANDLDSLHASLGICPHDIDHDGDTDVEDLLRFLDGYGTTCP